MQYEEFSSDLPPYRIVFNSAEENEEMLKRNGIDQEIRQLGKGQFRCDMAARSAEEAELFVDRFNTAVSIQLGPPSGAVALMFPRTANGRFLAVGENVGNDKLVFFPAGSMVDIVGPDLCGSESIAITPARFAEMIQVLYPDTVIPRQAAVIEGDAVQLHALRKTIVDLVAHPKSDPGGEQLSNLVAGAIAWMGDASSEWKLEGVTLSWEHIRAAKLAREFIHEHYTDGIRLEDLCRVAGVGVRTLQRCFRQYFDVTITEYLKTIRLEAARRELAAGHPSEDSVTTIALENGFTHLGRFSVEFRERFGQSPKKTLAMGAEQKSHRPYITIDKSALIRHPGMIH